MTSGRTQYRVLIVSAVEKIYEYITEILPPGEFSPILRAASAGEAKRMLVSDEADIVIINTPLPVTKMYFVLFIYYYSLLNRAIE